MDQGGRRKVRFTPKAPPRTPSKSKPTVTKTEKSDEDREAAAQAQYLLSRFNENVGLQKAKVEKKSSVQVAFGQGATSTSIRTYGVRRDGNINSSDSQLKDSTSNDRQIVIHSPSTANEDGIVACSSDATDALPLKNKKDYREPWDYHHTYYPTSLPLRRPYSGDPELLDEAEFGEAARNMDHDESIINPASDLELLEEHEKEKMFFLQLPANLPLVKRSASRKGKERAESSISSESRGSSKEGCSLKELSGGYMGKMLVYKSGAVKLKIGNTLYDVSPGSDCMFAQDVAAINTVDKHCCALGEVGKRAVVTLDVDSLLNNVINLD